MSFFLRLADRAQQRMRLEEENFSTVAAVAEVWSLAVMKKRKVDNNYVRATIKTTCLCEDMISNILVRLPVRSLIRFTLVCKSWNSLIRSPAFISAYNKLIPRRQRYLLYTSNKTILSSPPFVTFTAGADKPRLNLKRMPLDSFHVVGSCEGLVCVESTDVDIGRKLYLWNPLLQTFKILPPSLSNKTTTRGFVYGLGYSYTCNDHRVVKITYGSERIICSSNSKVEIYSLKSDSWRCIDSAPPIVTIDSTSVFTNGRINWVAASPPLPARPIRHINLWFDVDEESFGEKDLLRDVWVPNCEQPLDVNKAIPNDCDQVEEHAASLWKRKALACENSLVRIILHNWFGVHAILNYFHIFDGERFFWTSSKSVMNFLGVNDMAPLEKRDARMVQTFDVVCVAESLMLINNPVSS